MNCGSGNVTVAIDGTKILANASNSAAASYEMAGEATSHENLTSPRLESKISGQGEEFFESVSARISLEKDDGQECPQAEGHDDRDIRMVPELAVGRPCRRCGAVGNPVKNLPAALYRNPQPGPCLPDFILGRVGCRRKQLARTFGDVLRQLDFFGEVHFVFSLVSKAEK